jgi:hypothetical protein
MKIKTLLKLMMLSVIFFAASANFAQQGDQAEMMKKWQDYMTPGPVHQQFAKQVGNWKAMVTSYQGDQEMKSEGTAAIELLLGGRYLKSSFKGNMMGMPFEGMSLDAYDNAAKEYITVWIDSFGTGVLYMKGKMDEKTGEVIYIGTMIDPMTGKNATTKSVTRQTDEDHSSMVMYMVENGKEIKNMMVEYTRVK